jgi:hypothetical protein
MFPVFQQLWQVMFLDQAPETQFLESSAQQERVPQHGDRIWRKRLPDDVDWPDTSVRNGYFNSSTL